MRSARMCVSSAYDSMPDGIQVSARCDSSAIDLKENESTRLLCHGNGNTLTVATRHRIASHSTRSSSSLQSSHSVLVQLVQVHTRHSQAWQKHQHHIHLRN